MFTFGVFSKGKLIFAINRIKCTNIEAIIIVGILDMAKEALKDDHYFACEYESRAE